MTHDRTVWSEVERVIVLFNCRSFLLIQPILLMRSPAENVQSSVRTKFFRYEDFSQAQIQVERVFVLFTSWSFLLIQQMLLVLFTTENIQSGVCRIYIWYKSLSSARLHLTEPFARGDTCDCAVQLPIVFAHTTHPDDAFTSWERSVRRLQNLYFI